MGNEELYLRAILSLVARQILPPDKLSGMVGRDKQLAAYNLCDGTRTQSEIAKEAGLDPSNFRKALTRWVEAGAVIRTVQGKEQRPMHVYPLPAKVGQVKDDG